MKAHLDRTSSKVRATVEREPLMESRGVSALPPHSRPRGGRIRASVALACLAILGASAALGSPPRCVLHPHPQRHPEDRAAFRAQARGDHFEALDRWDSLSRELPLDAKSWLGVAGSAEALRDLVRARRALDSAIGAAHPGEYLPFIATAEFIARTTSPQIAHRWTLTIEPQPPEPYPLGLYLGRALERLQLEREALDAYSAAFGEQCIALDCSSDSSDTSPLGSASDLGSFGCTALLHTAREALRLSNAVRDTAGTQLSPPNLRDE